MQLITKNLPAMNDTFQSPSLTNVAIGWAQKNPSAAEQVFPNVEVDKPSGVIFKWNAGDFFRNQSVIKSESSKAPLINDRLEKVSYEVKTYQIGALIPRMNEAAADVVVKQQMVQTQQLMNHLKIQRDQAWVTAFFASSLWATTTTPGVLWDAGATSNPIADLRPKIASLILYGVDPMDITLSMGYEAWRKGIVDNDKFLGRYEFTQAAIMTEELVARVLGIGKVVVFKTSVNSAGEQATDSMGFIHGKDALLSVAPRAPSIDVPSGGYTLNWGGLVGGNGTGIRVRVMPSFDPEGTLVIADTSFAHVLTANVMGHFFSGVVS